MRSHPYLNLCCVLLCWCAGFHSTAQSNAKPLVFGQTLSIPSAILRENRPINIYLPEDYSPTDTVTYPVVYILDGGVEEDFFHFTGLIRYYTQPWIARFPRSIVVGIENTHRQRDFTFQVPNLDFLASMGFKKEDMPQYGGSAQYIAFLEKELQPYIRQQFKTRATTTVIGESLGGLLAAEMLVHHPQLFDHYIIISPSLWWGDEALLKAAAPLSKNPLTKPVKVYIGAPSKKESARMFKDAKTLFLSVSDRPNVTAFFDYLPEETHATVSHQAVYNAFKKLYPLPPSAK